MKQPVSPAATGLPTRSSNPAMTEDSWEIVSRVVKRLDEQGKTTADSTRLLRLLKLQEEVGEVAQAAIGATGANPRKGTTHTWEDVQHEVCDVILSGMAVLLTLTPDAEKVFQERLEIAAARSLTTGGPAAQS